MKTKTILRIGIRFLGVVTILFLLVSIPIVVLATTNSGDVSGTITYTGTITGTQTIYVTIHNTPGDPPVYDTSLTNPGGAYTVPGVADGTYYVSAYMDLDGSGGQPGSDEPIGWYDVDGDGNPDTITVSGGNITGVNISFGNHTPQITSMDGIWEQLGEAVSPERAEKVDLDFYSNANHNTPGLLFSNYSTGLSMKYWDGGDHAWRPVGDLNFAPGGNFNVALDISDNDVPYAAYADESNSYKVTVKKYTDAFHTWDSVGGVLNGSNLFDMQLKNVISPVVSFYDDSLPNGGLGSAMVLNASGWEYIGSAQFTPYTVDEIRLALDSNDDPWVAALSSNTLSVMKYTGNGSSGWEHAGGGTAVTSSASDISIAIDSLDTVYVAFSDGAHSGKATVMKHTGALSTSWQTVGSAGFSTCGSGAFYPDMTVDNNGVPYVVFQSYCDNGAIVMKYTGNGTTGWERVGDVGFSGGGIIYPVIRFNNDNTPFVAYIAYSSGTDYHKAIVTRYLAHPTITQTTVTMSEDASPTPFALSLRGEDEDGNALSWSIAGQGSHGTAAIAGTIGSSGTVTATLAYTPVANFNGEDSFIVQLDDGTATSTATVQITIEPTNDAPTAYFANRTVAQGETVMLDGTLSHDIDGDTLSDFHWTQTGGTSVSFTDNISRPTFVAPSFSDVLTFTLAVTDPGGLSDDHSGTVWVVGGDASTLVPTDTDTIFVPPTAPFTLTVPVGGVHQPISLIFTDTVGGYSPPVDRQFAGPPFSLSAYADGIEQTGFSFVEPFTITLHYSDDDISGLSESTLDLLYWNGSDWVSDGIMLISRDPANNQITFTVNHLTDFALVAEESYFIYLPLVLK